MNVLIISMFPYALEKQETIVKGEMFANSIEDYSIHAVRAMPDEIKQKLHGKQYDCAYADTFYDSAEIGYIRDHIQGKQQIERF